MDGALDGVLDDDDELVDTCGMGILGCSHWTPGHPTGHTMVIAAMAADPARLLGHPVQ